MKKPEACPLQTFAGRIQELLAYGNNSSLFARASLPCFYIHAPRGGIALDGSAFLVTNKIS